MEKDEYFLLMEGETHGPYTLEQLREMWFTKGIPLDTLYARPGLKQALPLDSLVEKIIAYKKEEPKPAQQLKPTKMSPLRWMAPYAIILTLLVIFIWSIAPFIAPHVKQANVVNALVRPNSVQVEITNQDNYDWENMVISLNEKPPEGYQMRISRLRSGATVRLQLVEFRDAEGKRYQPWSMRVQEVWIGGGERDFGRFRTPLR